MPRQSGGQRSQDSVFLRSTIGVGSESHRAGVSRLVLGIHRARFAIARVSLFREPRGGPMLSEAIKRATLGLALFASGCSWMNGLHVTAYQSVHGPEASPWPSGCLVTIESRTRRYVGLHGEPCARIAIGDKAVFNHEPDVIFWIDDKPYSVKSASKK